ncbi:MAG TPA: hypothetical protein PKY59_16670 [Pyrinomonadaceae bacterium]|nr:hypothetical protein [Pyrinomonadaceae bacterium]
MKKLILMIAVFVLSVANIFAQVSREKAEENPLDCALYLISKDKNSVDADFLPQRLIKIGRYDDAMNVIESDDNSYSRFETLAVIGDELLKVNKLQEADNYLMKAFAVLRDEEEWSHDSYIGTFAANLVRVNRSTEAFEILSHQEDDKVKAKILLSLAEVHYKLGQKEKAEKFIDESFALRASFSTPKYDLDRLINLLIENNLPKKTAEYLEQIREDILSIENEEDINHEMLNFFPLLYLNAGQKEKAFEIWDQYGDKNDSGFLLNRVLTLLEFNDRENAVSLFKKIKLNQDRSGHYGEILVEIYLKLNDVNSAIKNANEISADVDDYSQQKSYMRIVDKLIADKKTVEALNLLEFALQRAAKVGETHETHDSIGASPLTRKIIYLREIKSRYFKLNRFDQGLAVINSIKTRNDFYQEFYSQLLIHYVSEQTKTLPRKKIDNLLAKAEKVFDEDEDDNRNQAGISIAGVYSKLGDKTKAVEMLTKVLDEAVEESYREDYFLIEAALVFNQYELTADENLKTVLRKYIETVEN